MSDIKKLVGFLFEKNYLVSPDLLKSVPKNFNFLEFFERVGKNLEKQKDKVMFDKNLLIKKVEKKVSDVNGVVNIVRHYEKEPSKTTVKDFVIHYKNRYNQIKKFLMQRPELHGCVSMSRALGKKQEDSVAVIGFVHEISQTKNGHYIVTLEDVTGKIKVLVNAKNKDMMELMKEIVLDEIVGVSGVMGSNIIFARDLLLPDIPLKEYKKCKDDVSAVFVADMHIGSDVFLPEDFERFVSWLNLEYGSEEQVEEAKKVKYLFVVGDIVDGIGIYPGQDKELVIKDVVKQYDVFYDYMSKVRKDIKIVICGGNHDALRLSEPQPPLDKEFAGKLYTLSNVSMVSNPSIINIHSKEGFIGFDVLLYHGYAFDYYINNVDYLRNNGGYDRADLVMEFLLKKRHLSPTHIAGLYVTDEEKDPLVLDHVPDFFVSGHVHHDVVVGNYKNVCLIGCASFQKMTAFQEKLGHENIVPSRVPVVNLKTRNVKIFDFSCEEKS